MLVTIFPGPGDDCHRVREMAEGSSQPLTMGWFKHYDNAADYIRENYSIEDAIAPAEFRKEVLWRKGERGQWTN